MSAHLKKEIEHFEMTEFEKKEKGASLAGSEVDKKTRCQSCSGSY